MRNVVMVLALLTGVILLSGCLGSDITKIEQLTTTINDHLKQGDSYYNQAVTSSNKFSYEEALKQCNNAASEFDAAKSSTQEALFYSKNTEDQVYINYMQITLLELDARINATSELKTAIPLFRGNETRSANNHIDLANGYMQKSLEYSKQKQDIVNQNPNKFK